MELRASSRDGSAAWATAMAGDGTYVTPELLMLAVSDISARRRTSSAADITMYLQRRFPMRHKDRRLLKEVERKLQIAMQHGLFVHTGYSYRLPAEREGKALNSRDLSAFWSHYHRMECEYGSDSSTESEERSDAEGGSGDPGHAQQAPPGAPEPPTLPAPSPEPQPPTPPPAGHRRRIGRRHRRCRCSRCRSRSHSCSGSRGSRERQRDAGAVPRRRNPPRRARPAVATAVAKWRRCRQKRCVATTLHHDHTPENDAAGPSQSLVMYVVLQMPTESDDGTASN